MGTGEGSSKRRGSFAGKVTGLLVACDCTFKAESISPTSVLSASSAPATGHSKSGEVHEPYCTRVVVPKDALFIHAAAPEGRPFAREAWIAAKRSAAILWLTDRDRTEPERYIDTTAFPDA
ncbi:MAG: hypothetical protein NVS9B12_05620 [Vulcanimicrobiaceae bacterium]